MTTQLSQAFPSLQKLFVAGNKIENLFEAAGKLPSLTDLTTEGNPCELKDDFIEKLKETYPALTFWNLKKISTLDGPTKTPSANTTPAIMGATTLLKTHDHETKKLTSMKADSVALDLKVLKKPETLANNKNNDYKNLPHPILPFKPKNECNVIQIIQKEWQHELERLEAKKNAKVPKMYALAEKSLVQSGHAEIESNKVLYIYGNALEVLQRSEFYDQVEEIHLIYVRFDLIVYHANLDKLRQFRHLKKLVLAHNYLNSFILLSKIESLISVEEISMYENEVLRCVTLKSFLVYRFQHLKLVSILTPVLPIF